MRMRAIFEEIWRRAEPYLDTRKNDIHTKISIRFATVLLEKEGGDEDVVMPAIILHDVGWIRIPKDEQHRGYGPEIQSPRVVKRHELEGVEIAKGILEALHYEKGKTAEILDIIEGHDSRKETDSINESIVKDADKLWRFSREGFTIDCDRFNLKPLERVKKGDLDIDRIFFTESAKQIARKEIKERLKESRSEKN
ncbi:MAG: HD domain-containing protein [Deltaproteobacteria bacterium]|nr:MAG: HD domain-containing protein [Deltaproteobacteria bacterium]